MARLGRDLLASRLAGRPGSWIWGSGELGRAVQSERIPYAALLTDTVQGTTLLFIERPGRQLDYLVGAFAPEGLEEGYGDPHAPRSIVLPPFPGRAAQALTDRYLPSYEQAVHARQTAAIAAALGDIRSEHDTWQTMNASGRYSDATPLSAAALGAATELFLDHAWRRFLTVVDHAPTLIYRSRPTSSPWPDDTTALSLLADAVIDAETLIDEIVHGGSVSSQERNARAWPAIETWLTDGEIFLRQARVSAPHRRPALPVTAPARSLTTGRPAHRTTDRSTPTTSGEPRPLQPGTHFAFGDHEEHGFVASFTSAMPAHLAHWYLEREQFEPVPGEPGLYRLSEPERDGPRRTRQAVHDLRRQGYTVQADIRLDPAVSASPPRPVRPNGLLERRSRLAQAAAGRTTQCRATPPTTSPPAARPIPPKPTYAPTVHLTASGGGRSR